MRRALALTLMAGAALSAGAPAVGGYRAGPPPGHTGGFGEPTCTACHWAERPDAARTGALRLEVPRRYRPGAVHDLRVVLEDPGLRAAGFQLAVRFRDGEKAGRQAGSLAATDSATTLVTRADGVAYASHSAAGSVPAAPGRAEWVVRWSAPAEGGAVVVHAAANAANDDASEFGDRIHVAEALVPRR